MESGEAGLSGRADILLYCSDAAQEVAQGSVKVERPGKPVKRLAKLR
jgi:hypothetical protein